MFVWACRLEDSPSGYPLYSSLEPRCVVPLLYLTRNAGTH